MQITVNKSGLKGSVKVPSSKSQTIRALMCAALSKGESVLENPLVCEDTDAAADVLSKVGIDIQRGDSSWRVRGGTFRAPSEDLYCGESATTLRFMTAICSIIPGKCRLVGGPSLSERPVRSLAEALTRLGVTCSLDGKTTPPVTVEGGTLVGGLTELPGNISSQFISALFGINVSTSFDKYVVPRQTYQPTQFPVEGDWSSASYFLAMGALSEGIEVENITTDSVQGDRVILDILRNMGVKVRVAGNAVSVNKGGLKAVHADLSDCIDLLPTAAVLAALAGGTSEFTGIERARIKESDRVAAVKEGLEKVGVKVREERNRITITGMATKQPTNDTVEEKREPVTIDSRKDHRIAMAFAILGCALGDITITDAECVAKTYPGFWESLKNIGGKVATHE
jgi:3-phosphoshikimate 1-carboxyvinyltransferase